MGGSGAPVVLGQSNHVATVSYGDAVGLSTVGLENNVSTGTPLVIAAAPDDSGAVTGGRID